MRFKNLLLVALCAMVCGSCQKEPKPNEETIQILKEKEKVTVGTDWATFKGELAYSGVIDSMMLRVGTEEHLYGSEDYSMTVNGKTFSAEVDGLQPGTFYYYAYLVYYGVPTAWQSELYGFTTAEEEINLPTVTTVEVAGVTTTSASCLCHVVDDGGAEVTERGACWSTSPNPSVANSVYANGNGLGEYEVSMTDLEPNTTYYVRAYAKNSKGIGYGEVVSFTTLETMLPPPGCIGGVFSVSGDKQVWFSQGNLMYNASDQKWGFAEMQYRYIGNDNVNISEDYSGWIDLFGWGTSGIDHGAVCYQPWSTASDYTSYYAYGVWDYNLNDQTGQADWGYGVTIGVDGELMHPWHTLTQEEWDFLFHERVTTSGVRFVKAQVNGVNGVLLLPDEWSTSVYALNNVNQEGASFASNVISKYSFDMSLEPNGAVFLPAAGRRNRIEMEDVGSCCYYWSASVRSEKYAFKLQVDSDFVETEVTQYRTFGLSVRLVRDVERQ